MTADHCPACPFVACEGCRFQTPTEPAGDPSALSRSLLRLAYGLPPDPVDAEEFGRIFDATPLYGLTKPTPTEPAAATEETS